MKTLYNFLTNYHNDDSDEISVHDNIYIIETYFYADIIRYPTNNWDKAMRSLSKKLKVLKINGDHITVNMSEVIERNLDNFEKLFVNNDIDLIMEDMEHILSGGVSEYWFCRFVNAIKDYE